MRRSFDLKINKYVLSIILVFVLAVGMFYIAQNLHAKNTDLEWTFAGVEQEKLLIDVIKSASATLDIAIYSLTDPEIVAAIKDAQKRGVIVRIITDKQQAGGEAQTKALKILGSANIPIKLNSHSGLMHLKMTIADNQICTTGSFNYSKSASESNDEILVVIRNADTAKSFTAQFEKMWNDSSRFKKTEYKIAQSTTDTTITNEKNGIVYANCSAVKAAGKAPLRKGDPGYNLKLDQDGDGVACEK
jgi:phosphatidylserine/phosphatidylglycerophosphate/cardiolipin synthase-like enzyme